MFIPPIEKENLATIKRFQEQKLQELLVYLNQHSTFYSTVFKKNKIDITKIKKLEDLVHLPLTTKDDLQTSAEEFICVEREKIIDYNTTSGTLGKPVTFVLSSNDIDRLAYNEYISLSCADGSSKETYQLMTTIDRRFMAGLAYFLGARKMGAGVIRVGNGMPELQWDTIERVSPSALIAVPSFILKLMEYAEANNIDYSSSSIRKAICIGEPIRNPDFSFNTLGKKIQDKWDIKLYSTYASTEMGAAFTECKCGIGGHHHPELIITEFLDEHDRPVKEGELGELTISTLGVEAMPLFRFKTGDVCYHYSEPCECGRQTIRIGPIIGRKKQMIKYKGTTIYPPSIYDVLNSIKNVENYVVEVSTNTIGTDEILIKIGCKEKTEQMEKEIKDHFRAKLRVAPGISFDTVENINKIQFSETSRKPLIFIDKRN